MQLRRRMPRTAFLSATPAPQSSELAADLCELHDWIIANAPLMTKYSQDWVSYDTRVIPKPVLRQQVDNALKETDQARRAASAAPLLATVQRMKKVRDEGMPILARIRFDSPPSSQMPLPKRWNRSPDAPGDRRHPTAFQAGGARSLCAGRVADPTRRGGEVISTAGKVFCACTAPDRAISGNRDHPAYVVGRSRRGLRDDAGRLDSIPCGFAGYFVVCETAFAVSLCR